MKNPFKNADGTTSKTKIGASLFGLGAVIYSVANLVAGNNDWIVFATQIIEELGAVALAFGIRDIPIINTPKAVTKA